MERVDRPGHGTLSATRFAQLTGVSRERLRTWERRHGFPVPVRHGDGPRRYSAADVARVVAVRQAADTGVRISQAIARTRDQEPAPPPGAATFAALIELAPLPVALISGPQPLRVEWLNAALRAVPGAPRAGEQLALALPAFAGSPCAAALARLFATAAAAPVELEHPAWNGDARLGMRSAIVPLPAAPGSRPLVAMIALAGDGELQVRAALAEREGELAELRRRTQRHARWLDAIAELAQQFRVEPGPAAIERGLEAVVRKVNALDGAIADHSSGRLRVARSRRGLLADAQVTVAAHPELATSLRDGTPLWLGAAAAAALGVPAGLHASAVPIVVAGDALGLLVFVFDSVEPHDHDNGRLLTALSAAMGFALLRDRLARELRDAATSR